MVIGNNLKDFAIRFWMPTAKEGLAEIEFPEGARTKQDKVFYNPEMQFNRDISVLALEAYARGKKGSHPTTAADTMAATGIRAIRYAKETSAATVFANDINPSAVELMKKNSRKNKTAKKMQIAKEEANAFLSKHRHRIDFVDIDPFGSPMQFLNSAARAVYSKGMIAVTATDTAPLCGTYPKKCMVRYGAKPLRGELGKEVGLRILMMNIARECAVYEKGFVPALCFADRHYFRIFGRCSRSKVAMRKSLGNLGYMLYCRNCKARGFTKDFPTAKCAGCKQGKQDYAGPLYIGNIFDPKFISEMEKIAKEKKYLSAEVMNFLETVKKESRVNGLPYDLHQYFKGREIPTTKSVLENLKKKKIKAAVSHLGGNVVRAENMVT